MPLTATPLAAPTSYRNPISAFIHGFMHGPVGRRRYMRQEKDMRNGLEEDRVDSMIDDSFPASDPPSTY
ncbi:MAG: hypothetical protein JF615_10595 [Asticcacaulis sp.]|nr:hypothetical protein [Asticcacaulis sp.]